MLSEIVLIITLGYSPSGASGTSMTTLEYVQPDMRACLFEQRAVNDFPDEQFHYTAMCISRAITK